MTLTDGLLLADGGVAAVVGCLGKTSLIARLSDENRHRQVLITPTTKMRPMERSVGVFSADTGKLGALPAPVLAKIVPEYQLVLLEADGSRGLPCKGWREDEPVVPAYCTHTIGVVTLRALGRPANDEVCHRLPHFLALTGLSVDEPITMAALLAMICAPEGMFRHSAGQRCLVVNQVEDAETGAKARTLLEAIHGTYPNRFASLLYGSVHQNQWRRA